MRSLTNVRMHVSLPRRALLPDFTCISQAVRMVPDGSTISVHDGDYVESAPIVITSRVILKSASHVVANVVRRLNFEVPPAGNLVGAQSDEQVAADHDNSSLVGDEVEFSTDASNGGNSEDFSLAGVPPTLGGLLAVGGGVGAGGAVGGGLTGGDDDQALSQSNDDGASDAPADAEQVQETGVQGAIGQTTLTEATGGASTESNASVALLGVAGYLDAAHASVSVLPVTPPAPSTVGKKKGMPDTKVTVRMFARGDARKDPLLVVAAPMAVVQVAGITFLHLRGGDPFAAGAVVVDGADDEGGEGEEGALAETAGSAAGAGTSSHNAGPPPEGVSAVAQGDASAVEESRGSDEVGEDFASPACVTAAAPTATCQGGGSVQVSAAPGSCACSPRHGTPPKLRHSDTHVEDRSASGARGQHAAGQVGDVERKCGADVADAKKGCLVNTHTIADGKRVGSGAVAGSCASGMRAGEDEREKAGGASGDAQSATVSQVTSASAAGMGASEEEADSIDSGGVDDGGDGGEGESWEVDGEGADAGSASWESLSDVCGGELSWRCVEVLRGVLEMSQCVVRSEEGNGVMVRHSGAALFSHCQVSHCGLHGVSALHGALVDSYHCKVCCNALSGYNAVGKGACVRCQQCQVFDNEDGGVNVLQGALALASASKLTANRGTGVRAVGVGSWAVQSDCTITLNGWHGVSALQGGSALVQRSSLMRNMGAGVNAFSKGRASILSSRLRHNRFGVWAQNESCVEIQDCSTGPSKEEDETCLGDAVISHLPLLPA